MIDLVQAGPFTFCPSMFVAAYVESNIDNTIYGEVMGVTRPISRTDANEVVVLVLTSGEYRASMQGNNSGATPAAIVADIHTKVAAYFNSLP